MSSLTGIEIRDATSADLEPILALLRSCVAGMCAHGIDQWDEVYPGRPTIEADLRAGTAVVAVADGTLAGYAALDDRQEPEYGDVAWTVAEPAGVIHRLMVTPRFEGRGVARAVMAFLEKRAGSLGHASIRLDVFVENPRAVRFYERQDYRRAGQVRFRKGIFYCYEKRLAGRS